MHSISLGPVGLSIDYAFIWATLLLAWGNCYLLTRRKDHAQVRYQLASNVLFSAFAVGFFCARAGFVVTQWQYFNNDVLAMLDVRDGGFAMEFGFIASVLFVSISIHRHPDIRATLLWSGLITSAIMLPLYIAVSLSQRSEIMPTPRVVSLSGNPVSLADFQDKPLVINFWATWCPPCRREMPALARAQQHNPDIHIVLINQSESADDVSAFLTEQDWQISNVLMDHTGSVSREFGVAVLPTTLFYSPDGNLVYRHIGGMSDASLAKALDALHAGQQEQNQE